MSPIVSSIVCLFLIFLLVLSLDKNSSTNLSSKSCWADINFGKEIDSLSNNINYNESKSYYIYCSKVVEEREGDKSLKLPLI
jgi:hypothetical protein